MSPSLPADFESWFACRSAIEGLRAGVPNRFSVAALGCSQPKIIQDFEAQLPSIQSGQPARGLLIRGGFGAGKSHALQYLGAIALHNGFVCSRLYVSKETPLYDPVKLFSSAAESASIPDRAGNAFVELANKLVFNSPTFRDLERWVNQPANRIDPRFAASLLLFEKFAADHEFRDQMIRFWAGEKLPVAAARKRLREIGETYASVHLSARELAVQRFRFAARLIRAAGYAGWVLLVDEVELIGSYSLLQRARSYVEIARLMNAAKEPGFGVFPVLAVTDEYGSVVLEDKGDLDKVPLVLAERALDSNSPHPDAARAGMQILNSGGFSLKAPDETVLDETYEMVRGLYARAYQWETPVLEIDIRREQTTPLRTYIRTWITQWDLKRLYGADVAAVETESYHNLYVEEEDEQGGPETESDASIREDLTSL